LELIFDLGRKWGVRSVENGVIRDVSFEGPGCAIAIASASLTTESVNGKTVAETGALFARVQRMVGASLDAPVDDLDALSALASVRRFPVRVKYRRCRGTHFVSLPRRATRS
jgi:NifU-like protein involved in Fe-S cluster formation